MAFFKHSYTVVANAVSYRGTIKEHKPFDPKKDAETLAKAMKGLGTDEKIIMEILTSRTNIQRQEIAQEFKNLFDKDLFDEIKRETSGRFQDVMLGLMMTPDQYDAMHLHKALKGFCKDEHALVEILGTRSNKEIKAIKETYKESFKTNLEDDIKNDISGIVGKLLLTELQAKRDDSNVVNEEKAKSDAKALFLGGETSWQDENNSFPIIFGSQNFAQIKQMLVEYTLVASRDLEATIRDQLSGHFEQILLAIVKCSRDREGYFAARLYLAMKGLGTDDKTLIRLIVSRCEHDLVQIKQAFNKAYGKTLESYVAEDTNGDYKKALVSLVNGN